MLPAEVLRMGRDTAVVFVQDAPHPVLAGRLRYFEDARLPGYGIGGGMGFQRR